MVYITNKSRLFFSGNELPQLSRSARDTCLQGELRNGRSNLKLKLEWLKSKLCFEDCLILLPSSVAVSAPCNQLIQRAHCRVKKDIIHLKAMSTSTNAFSFENACFWMHFTHRRLWYDRNYSSVSRVETSEHGVSPTLSMRTAKKGGFRERWHHVTCTNDGCGVFS